MNKLFDVPPIEPEKHEHSGEICGHCKHAIGYKYDSGKVFYYCEITKCNRSQFKIKKIAFRKPACKKFKNGEV